MVAELKSKEQSSAVEDKMQSRPGSYSMAILSNNSCELLEPILTQAFFLQPLLGNVILSQEQREKLHKTAMSALSGALRRTDLSDYGLSFFQCDILVFETVLLLRDWNGADNENHADGDISGFWSYICDQYAQAYDDNIYKIFKHVIDGSLKRNKRLLLESGQGQRYYTTMLIHALAPKKKFNDFFEQLFYFYAKSLNYHYVKADPAFRAFVDAMKNRFENRNVRSDDDVHIKSVQSSSAITALFLYCPKYMPDFVESVVSDIDTLVATGSLHETSYLNTLLLEWYEKRNREERSSDRRERSKAGAERPITEFANIRPAYRYESGKVLLVLPSIRLGEKSDAQPQITIYRYPEDKHPYSEKLRYYGEAFCITSNRTPIPIELLLSGEAERIELCAVITYSGKDIYDSGERLYRDFIVFDEDGGEISKRPDDGYIDIFVTKNGNVQGEDTSPDCTGAPCGKGFLYRAFIDDKTQISVNGTNFFPIEQKISGFKLSTSIAPVSHCRYLANQHEYTIFTKQPALILSSEIQPLEKQFHLKVDNIPYPLAQYYDDSCQGFSIPLPAGYGVHEVKIVENISQYQIYILSYVLIKDFSLRYGGFYYCAQYSDNGFLEISDCVGSKRYPYEILSGQSSMLVPYEYGDLSIDIPVLGYRLNGEVLSAELQQMLWHEDIPMSALLEVDIPRGYNADIVIGQRLFKSTTIEIGNEIRARHDSSIDVVKLIIRKGDAPALTIKLFDIAFEPLFKSSPLLVEREGLLWCFEGNYIGSPEDKFEIRIHHKSSEIGCYRVGYADEVIPFDCPLKDGVYDYTIFKKSSGLLAKFEKLTSGHFLVGDPALFRFDDRAVIVTEAFIENDPIKLNPSLSIITNLRYIGEQDLNGEAQRYPCYEGHLYYKNDGNLRLYATTDYGHNGEKFERVNPIKLWVINDYIISLRGPEDDGLYVNKRWKSITDREPPDRKDAPRDSRSIIQKIPIAGRMPLNQGTVKRVREGENDYCNPDYYSFKVIPFSEVENV